MNNNSQLFVGIDIAAQAFTAACGKSINEISPALEFEQKQVGTHDW